MIHIINKVEIDQNKKLMVTGMLSFEDKILLLKTHDPHVWVLPKVEYVSGDNVIVGAATRALREHAGIYIPKGEHFHITGTFYDDETNEFHYVFKTEVKCEPEIKINEELYTGHLLISANCATLLSLSQLERIILEKEFV